MPTNLSIKNVPDAMAARLRERAQRNHRSLQGELMAILENAAIEPNAGRVNTDGTRYVVEAPVARAEGLLDRLMAIAGDRGINATKRLTREQAHDRKSLRKAGA